MSSHSDRAVQKYLGQWAEPEAGLAERLLCDGGARFGHVVAIPACGEHESLLESLASVPGGPAGEVLIIVVVNERTAAPAWVTRANRDVLARLREGVDGRERIADHVERFLHPRGTLVVVDRTRPETVLPEGQGVGLARKIGADLALAIHARGGLASPWIHCTDADVILPSDYFERPQRFERPRRRGRSREPLAPSALIYDFEHRADDDETRDAALRYEIFLRYLRLGLLSAGSRYAHHSIGSVIAVSPRAYAQVRGFPRRQAAEDFYLLNKLAKLGSIESLPGAPIVLSGRVSQRVPFGTGAAVSRQIERARARTDLPAYDPRVFAWLRAWIRALDDLVCSRSGVDDATVRDDSSPDAFRRALSDRLARFSDEEQDVDPETLLRVLEELGEVAAVQSIVSRVRDGAQRARRIHERFDALRTLKLIHALRDDCLPSIPLEEALARAHFLASIDIAAPPPGDPTATAPGASPPLAALREKLAHLEVEISRVRD